MKKFQVFADGVLVSVCSSKKQIEAAYDQYAQPLVEMKTIEVDENPCFLPLDALGIQLAAGCLYCMGNLGELDETMHMGALAWYSSDGNFYYEDSGEEVSWPYDFAVLQQGSFSSLYC